MGKYFDMSRDEDLMYSEQAYYIATMLRNFGILKCSINKMEDLWIDFSEERFCAGYMIPNPELVEEFANWLERRD